MTLYFIKHSLGEAVAEKSFGFEWNRGFTGPFAKNDAIRIASVIGGTVVQYDDFDVQDLITSLSDAEPTAPIVETSSLRQEADDHRTPRDTEEQPKEAAERIAETAPDAGDLPVSGVTAADLPGPPPNDSGPEEDGQSFNPTGSPQPVKEEDAPDTTEADKIGETIGHDISTVKETNDAIGGNSSAVDSQAQEGGKNAHAEEIAKQAPQEEPQNAAETPAEITDASAKRAVAEAGDFAFPHHAKMTKEMRVAGFDFLERTDGMQTGPFVKAAYLQFIAERA